MAWGRHRNGNWTKYGNSTRARGASLLEDAVEDLLRLRELAGELILEAKQDNVFLTQARLRYIPDFRCRDLSTGEVFYVEAKGMETDIWKRNLRLWRAGYGPGRLEIWKGSYKRPYLDETVTPQLIKFVPELSLIEYDEFIRWKLNQVELKK